MSAITDLKKEVKPIIVGHFLKALMVDKYTAGSQYGCHFRQEHGYASGSVYSHILLTISLCSLKMSGNR